MTERPPWFTFVTYPPPDPTKDFRAQWTQGNRHRVMLTKKMKVTRKRLRRDGQMYDDSKVLEIQIKRGWKAGAREISWGSYFVSCILQICSQDVGYAVGFF